MGGSSSISWKADEESPSGGGPCVLTDPIETLSAEDVFKAYEMYIRERPLNTNQYEVGRTLKDLPDGGLHEELTIEVTGVAALVAGDIKMKLNSIYYVKDNEFKHDFFFDDSTLKERATTTLIRAIPDPFRLEATVDEFNLRYSGPVMRSLLKTRLAKLGYDVEVTADADAVCDAGLKSVLSAEIGDPELTTSALWEKLSAQLEADGTGARLPDGSVVVETPAGGMVSGGFLYEVENAASGGSIDGASYMKWMYCDEKITCLDFGFSMQMEEVRVVTHLKVHAAPVRVEAWAVNVGRRRSGELVKKICENLLIDALKFAGERTQK